MNLRFICGLLNLVSYIYDTSVSIGWILLYMEILEVILDLLLSLYGPSLC